MESDFEARGTDLSKAGKAQLGSDYLAERLILPGDAANVVMTAYTGLGKTTLNLEVALGLTMSVPIWGALRVPRKLRVAYVDQDNVEAQITETAKRLFRVYGTPEQDMLTVITGGGGGSFCIDNGASLEALMGSLDRFRAGFVFLDGWQWFIAGKINDPETVSKTTDFWKHIRNSYGELLG